MDHMYEVRLLIFTLDDFYMLKQDTHASACKTSSCSLAYIKC